MDQVKNGTVTQKAEDKQCQGCHGRGAGKHTDLRCPYLLDETKRAQRAERSK